jgi:hypothetical protein
LPVGFSLSVGKLYASYAQCLPPETTQLVIGTRKTGLGTSDSDTIRR